MAFEGRTNYARRRKASERLTMRDTLLYLLQAIADHPDDITVEESTSEDLPAQAGKTIFTIHAHPEDMGKIIGKGGRIIRSIRDLTKLMAAKQGIYVDVVLAE